MKEKEEKGGRKEKELEIKVRLTLIAYFSTINTPPQKKDTSFYSPFFLLPFGSPSIS